MKTDVVPIENPKAYNVIIGQSHFIKTVEDIHETLVAGVPGIKFGLAFCEASATRLVRTTGTSDAMVALARENALRVGCGHAFFIFLENTYPINVLNAVKMVPEVVTIFCATANPVSVVVLRIPDGAAVLGVIDGGSPLGVEKPADVTKRKTLLRVLGYKLS
jgi:hypothetical protein